MTINKQKLSSPCLNTLKILMVLITPFLWSAEPCLAESAINCHCFQNREYNATRKFAADDYMLATGFNSLLAGMYPVSKKSIIMLKMQHGVGSADLLTALYLSRILDTDFQQFLKERATGLSWQQIVSSAEINSSRKKDKVVLALSAGNEESATARASAAVIEDCFSVSENKIKEFRANGLDDKMIVVLLALSHECARSPEELASGYLDKGQSWSEIAASCAITPGQIGKKIEALAAKSSKSNGPASGSQS
ncbi:MAG: hypothetical protein U9R66_12770 [Thermodesulfobacteriota bacterium]|nr:hypothetical protein [Thermodesulfobacteriota bacterium]